MKSRFTLLLSLLLAGGLAHTATATTDYEIRFQRPVSVGERYRVVATGDDEQSMVASIDGQEVQRRGEKYRVDYTADTEILALTSGGRTSKARLTIVKLVRTAGDQSAELLPAGTVLIAEKSGQRTIFKEGDNPVSRPVAAALEAAGVSIAGETQVDDDQVFGTKERKQVGDTWPINAAPAVAELAKSGLQASADNVSGRATLTEVVPHESGPALRVKATMDLKGVTPPLPPGLEVQASVFNTTLSGLFPVDLTRRELEMGMSLVMEIKASGTRDGRTMEMSMTKKTSHEAKFSRR